jgi:hypothetical protein
LIRCTTTTSVQKELKIILFLRIATMASIDIYTSVDKHYSRLARETTQETASQSEKVALSFGYSAEELAAIPGGANLGVSCGNPIALAALKEVSIDDIRYLPVEQTLTYYYREKQWWIWAVGLDLTSSLQRERLDRMEQPLV